MKYLLALTLTGCGLLSDSTLPADLSAEYACIQKDVESGQTNVGQIAIDCRVAEESIVIDFINGLLSSSDWTSKHASLVPALQKATHVAR